MNAATHSLSASITSALALKPSTVYILRVENTKTRQSWHIRRCFSEFCELREKLLSLIDDQMAAYLTSPELDSSEDSYTASSSISSSASTASISSHRRHCSPLSPSDRFAFVFKQFPPRKLFGSRSKRVIETRSMALNRFLQQALEVVEVVRQRQLIAICFSMMTHIESFLEYGAHRQVTRVGPSCSLDRDDRSGAESPSAARRTIAAVSLTPCFHHYPLVPSPAFTMTQRDDRYQSSASRYGVSEVQDSDDAQRFNNFDFTRRFYREFGRQEERAEIYDEDSDDEEMQMLKKTWSAMLESETHERKLYHTGSHFSMLGTGYTSETWTRRIEIAGIQTAKSEELSATCLVGKTSECQRAEQRLNRYQSNCRIPVQDYPTSG
ncbi:PX domain-containing protein [Phytophthora infestans]|uniref:PX domain-containing protein n=1 Tax=Phytophthora infestans TaxID=4787 RepID=A0A833W7B9_PHYIN|nr:PX domain-containing protein [Phytophthora infestans]KAF4131518.1 PX domain-containing protein [Phytophthora infestans]